MVSKHCSCFERSPYSLIQLGSLQTANATEATHSRVTDNVCKTSVPGSPQLREYAKFAIPSGLCSRIWDSMRTPSNISMSFWTRWTTFAKPVTRTFCFTNRYWRFMTITLATPLSRDLIKDTRARHALHRPSAQREARQYRVQQRDALEKL